MGLKKLQIKLKGNHDARGTKDADVMMDIFRENWDQIQDKYNNLSESERTEMLDHFNSQFENIGDSLFGSNAGPEELAEFIDGLDDGRKKEFCECAKEALEFDGLELDK